MKQLEIKRMKCSRKRLAIVMGLIIIEPLFGKMIQNHGKISVLFGLAVLHKGCVVGFHGCTRMPL